MIKKIFAIAIILLAFYPGVNPAYAVYEKYTWEKSIPLNTNAAADDLKTELSNEVQKIINAGHLEPGYYSYGIPTEKLLWGYPGEQIYILSLSLKYLPASGQTALKAFLAQELSNYPPYQIGFLHGPNNQGWGLDVMDGNRREFFPLDPSTSHNIYPPVTVPPESLFMLWTYADATGDWQYISNNWNNLVNIYNSIATPVTRYGEIAGLSGMARLADEMGKSPWSKSNAASVKSNALGKAENAYSLADYNQYVTNMRSNFPRIEFHDWMYPIFCSTYQAGAVSCFFNQETGRYLRDYQFTKVQPAIAKYINTATTYPDALYPGWFIHRSDHPDAHWRLGNNATYVGEDLALENAYHTPELAWTFFMFRAYVFKDNGPTLRSFVDFPTSVGDLYHIQRLTATIDGYSQECWEDILTTAAECTSTPTPSPTSSATASPTPTPSPTPPPKVGDINGDGVVNVVDFSIMLSKWNTSDPSADLNKDGIVNVVDFSILLSNWGT